jgi:lipopolysaccharide export system protein LptA
MQKRFIPILVLAAIVLLAAQGNLWGKDNRPKLMKGGENKPIEIVSDRLDAFREKDLVQFSGNVVATQGDRVIKSDALELYFKKKAEGSGAAAGDAAKAGDIDRIVAKGNVHITEKERIVTGEQAVFLNDEQRIVVTGNPVMREGNNVIAGDRVVVYLNENRGVVEGTTGKRVTATIYPDESKGKKKKE